MITTVKTSSVVQGMPKYRSMLAGNPAYIPSSYESIATATGTGSSGTITFSSIPSTFKHLQIRMLSRSTDAGVGRTTIEVRFNSDSGSNYAWHYLKGDGSAAEASGTASQTYILTGTTPDAGATANRMGVAIIDVLDYSSSTKNKTLRSITGEDQNGNGQVRINSGLWMSTNAITAIEVKTSTGSWTTSSTFALYGIKEF